MSDVRFGSRRSIAESGRAGPHGGRTRFTLCDYDGPMPEAPPAAPVQARSI